MKILQAKEKTDKKTEQAQLVELNLSDLQIKELTERVGEKAAENILKLIQNYNGGEKIGF